MAGASYVLLTITQYLNIYVVLLAVCAFVGWLYFYQLGRVLIDLAPVPRELKTQREAPITLPLFTGMWFWSVAGVALGLLGVFKPLVIAAIGAATVAYSVLRLRKRGAGGGWVSSALRFYHEDRFIWIVTVLGAVLCVVLSIHQPMGWYDDNFTIAAAHLVHTGAYPTTWSRGGEGMAIMTALSGLLFPKMAIQNSMMGWSPFSGAFMILGCALLIQELFGGKSRWAPVGVLIVVFPLFSRVFDVRSSLTSFILIIWSMLFALRYARTKSRTSALASAMALAATWQYAQVGVLFGAPTLIGIALIYFLRGDKEQSTRVLRVLGLGAALDVIPALYDLVSVKLETATHYSLPHVILSLWPFILAGSLPWIALLLVPKLPRLRVGAWILGALTIAVGAAAYHLNPPGAATYSWFNINIPADFILVNFSSYGLLGWLFAAAVVWAVYDSFRGRFSPILMFLLVSFLVSLSAQVFAPMGLRLGIDVPAGRAQFWNLWKDAVYKWNNLVIVVGLAYPLERLAAISRRFSRRLTPTRLKAALVVPMVFCMQSAKPYIEHWRDMKDWVHFAYLNATPTWWIAGKGQQIYSIPMYLAFGHDMPTVQQQENCTFCTMFVYQDNPGFTDYLLSTPTEPGDTMAAAQSVLNGELYVTGNVRYSEGPNTYLPIYIGYLGAASTYEFYWKPGMKIRRATQGMAYSVADPARNLVHVELAKAPNGDLTGTFKPPYGGRFEALMGDGDFHAPSVSYQLDGKEVDLSSQQRGDTFGADLGMLKADATYRITVRQKPGAPIGGNDRLVVYPWRFWKFEQALYQDEPFFMHVAMRLTGVPSALVSVEDLRELATERDPARLQAEIRKWNIRYLVIDKTMRTAFPGVEDHLASFPFLEKHGFGDVTVFRYER